MFQIWKKLKHGKVVFMWLKYIYIFVILCKGEEKCEENWQFLGTNISRSTEANSFNFDMWSSVHVRQKYINLVEIGWVVLEIWKAEFSNFTAPVNNTLVCCKSFLFSWLLTHYCVPWFQHWGTSFKAYRVIPQGEAQE